MLLVGINNGTDQGMTHDIPVGKITHGDAGHGLEGLQGLCTEMPEPETRTDLKFVNTYAGFSQLLQAARWILEFNGRMT